MEPSIEESLVEAIRLVDGAEAAAGGEALATARCLLRGLDIMSAKDALMAIWAAAKSCDVKNPNRGILQAAERNTRDVVVLFIVNRGGGSRRWQPPCFRKGLERSLWPGRPGP